MTDITGSMLGERGHHLSLRERAATWFALALAGTIFFTIGWFAMAPDDPLGAVSVFTRRGAWLMLLQAAGLAAVTGGVATVIAGRRLPEVGTFASAVGLATVSLRGGTAGSLLIQWADVASSAPSSLSIRLAMEALAWFVILFVARGFSIAVGHWCQGNGSGSSLDVEQAPSRDSAPNGIKHLLIVGGASLLTFKILTAGLSTRSVQHGQACFVVAASVCLASYLGCWLVPVRSALWVILSVPLLAIGGYVWAWWGPSRGGLPTGVPTSAFLHVLPIQYISVGTAAAVAMHWHLYHPVVESANPSHTSSPHALPEGRG